MDNAHENGLIIKDCEIEEAEKVLLPEGSFFSDEARSIIRYWDSCEVLACPGSGKTTVLLAKLKMLANRMPLNNNAGICVLSHTNVAVNEIKAHMKEEASKLLGYPNFVGTIQSFIDKFITLPFIRTQTSEPIQFVDTVTYSSQLWTVIKGDRYYASIKGFLYNKVKQSGGRFLSEADFLQYVYVQNDGLYLTGQQNRLAGNTSQSFMQYKSAVSYLLKDYGILKYSDAYEYANQAMNSLDSNYIDLFNRRFSYVFIDEYQDCNEVQRKVIDRVFDPQKCTVVKMGDVDQSIFNGKNEPCLWEPKAGFLPLSYTNRYGQEIADILTPLKTGKESIVSNKGRSSIKPTLIIYDDTSRSMVIDTFLSALDKNGLLEIDGTYKAVGKIKNLDGLSIRDYWGGYNPEKSKSIDRYWNYIDEICESLSDGKLYKAEMIVRKLFSRVLRFFDKRDDAGKWYTVDSIKNRLDTAHFASYRSGIIGLPMLDTYDRRLVDHHIRQLFVAVLGLDESGKNVFEHMPSHFMSDTALPTASNINNNVFTDIRGRRIMFDTVHGVKGETHDATLYLETKENRSTDLKRVLPLWEGNPVAKNQTVEYARRCVYVGMSRPRKLLCVAMMGDTYCGHEKAFNNWDVIDIRKETIPKIV